MKIFSGLTVALLIIFQSIGFAATETFSASGEYLMSDYDTPEIAEEIALDFAKQNAAEQAGIYLESYSLSIDAQLDKDEIKTVASSKVEVLEKNISRQPQADGRILLRADIKAKVDTSELDNFVKQTREQRQAAIQQYKSLQEMNAKIKQDIDDFQKKLATIKDEVKDDDLIVEQERINREFLSTQKLKELSKLNTGDYINGQQLATAAVKLNPKNGTAYIKRGQNIYFAENALSGVGDYNRALILEPENSSYLQARGYFYKNFAKDLPRAIEDYNLAVNFAADDKQLFFSELALMGSYRDTKNFSAGIKNFTQIINRHPQQKWAYGFRGDLYKFSKDYGRAVKDYTQVTKLDTKGGYGYIQRGRVYAEMKNYSKAIEDYSQALKVDKECLLFACQSLRDVYRTTKNYSGGVEKFAEIVKMYPRERWSYLYRAKMYAAIGDNERALKDYDKVIEIADTPSLKQSAYEFRAEFYKGMGDNARAVEDYTNVINVDPTDKWSYVKRAQFYIELKDYAHVLEDYTNIINLDPNDAENYINRAFWYKTSAFWDKKPENYSRAVEDYTQAIKLNPNIGRAYAERGECYEQLKDYSRALEDYNQRIKIYPDSPLGYIVRGHFYEKRGEFAYNGITFSKSLNDNAANFEQAADNFDRALADYDKALELDPNNKAAQNGRQRIQKSFEDLTGLRERFKALNK